MEEENLVCYAIRHLWRLEVLSQKDCMSADDLWLYISFRGQMRITLLMLGSKDLKFERPYEQNCPVLGVNLCTPGFAYGQLFLNHLCKSKERNGAKQ